MNFDEIDRMMKMSYESIITAKLDGLFSTYKDSVLARLSYYRFLYRLVERIKPSYCLEIGVEYGIASAYMCAAASIHGGRVIGIDINWHSVPAQVLPEMFGNYDFICMSSVDGAFDEVLKITGVEGIGIVFQDSSHHYNESILEWEMYNVLLSDDAVWVCDDITPAFHDPKIDPPGKSMLEYFNERPGNKKLYPYANGGNAIGVILL